jgi:hypothetical protein
MTILEKYNSAKFYTTASMESLTILQWWVNQKVKPCISLDTETTSLYSGVPSQLCTQILTLDAIENPSETPCILKKRKAQNDTKDCSANYKVEQRDDLVVFGISCAIEKDEVVHCFWGRLGTLLYKKLCKVAAIEGPKCFHNARFDIRACASSDITLSPEIECTYTMSRIYWDRRKAHGLDDLAKFLCPEICDWENVIKKELTRLRKMFKKAGYPDSYVNYSFIRDEIIAPYAMKDAFMCLMLWKRLQGEAKW